MPAGFPPYPANGWNHSLMTRLPDEHRTDRRGIALVSYIVHSELEWLFRETPAPDVGIDGQIEICVSERPAGRLFGVQVKSGRHAFREPAADGWVLRFAPQHLTYWLGYSLPVLVVLADTEQRKAYWQHVTPSTVRSTGQWFKITVPRSNELNATARAKIRRSDAPSARPIRSVAADRSHGPFARIAAEFFLLVTNTPPLTQNVPSGSISGTTNWSAYEAAMRAAALWLSPDQDGRAFSARELAAMTFGDTKGWTPERMTAFAKVIGRPFGNTVPAVDATLRIRGPVQVKVGTVVADALLAHPWVTVPPAARQAAILVDCGVKGVLIVENPQAHKMVCQLSGITARWLCLQAPPPVQSIADAIAPLGRVPVAAWCDGDIDGVRLVGQLQRALGLAVHPIGMDVDLLKLISPSAARPRTMPRDLTRQTPDVLYPLLELIERNGGRGYEQEAVASQVLPTLEALLHSLEQV